MTLKKSIWNVILQLPVLRGNFIRVWLKYVNFLGHFYKILLPLGISYYTLQTIAYFMDIYNSKYEAEKKFFKYFMFVSFFPQLIMGPINRYNQLGKQMQEVHPFDFENTKHGVMLLYAQY